MSDWRHGIERNWKPVSNCGAEVPAFAINRSVKEFFKLAGVWLDCRLAELLAAGGADYCSDPFHAFLGQMDYEAEMGLLLREFREANWKPVSNSER
jgi:hypothetical protein